MVVAPKRLSQRVEETDRRKQDSLPEGFVFVRRGALTVKFPKRALEIIDAYEEKRMRDRLLRQRAHGRTIPQLIRLADSEEGKSERGLRDQVRLKREADAKLLKAAGTRDFKSATELAKAFSVKLEEEFQSARRRRGNSGRALDDRRSSTSVHTVSGGLPTLGRGHR